MSDLRQVKRRRIFFIYPRFQGGVALAFVAIVFVGGTLFAWHVDRDVRQALRDAALAGHYQFRSAYDVVGAGVARDVAGLFAGTALAGAALFFLGIRRIRVGTGRIVEAFRRMEDGDLSTPADVAGPGEFAAVGRQVDEARARTREIVAGIRAEVGLLRTEPLSEEEFLARWKALKEKIGGLAP